MKPKISNNFKLSHQTKMVNPPTLIKAKCQVKPKHKIVLTGDIHARGCASKLQQKLKKIIMM